MIRAILLLLFFVVSYFVYFSGVGYLATLNVNFFPDYFRFLWLNYISVWFPFLILLLILWIVLFKLRIAFRVAGFILAGYFFIFLVVANPFAFDF